MRRAWLLVLLFGCTSTSLSLPAPVALRTHDTAMPVRPALTRLVARDAGNTPQTLIAAPRTYMVGEQTIEGYGYDTEVFELDAGDVLDVTLDNRLDVPTTIHWHGAGAPYEMDGVPWMRSPTPPGGTFRYSFTTENPGTFWFHPHFDTERQVDLGLYGVLLVHDPSDPPVDDDLVLVFDSWGEAEDDPHSHALEGSEIRWSVNGEVDPIASVSGRYVRARLLNASNTGYLDLDVSDMVVLAHDQGVHTQPWTTSSVVLGPGDRVELLLDLEAPRDLLTRPFSLHGGSSWGEPTRLLTLAPTGPGTVAAPSWSTPVRAPSSDPGRTDIVYTFQGDTGTGAWRINHEVFPDVTIEEVAEGSEVIVEVRNLSPTNHPFHGHGHAFEVLSIDGVAPDRKRIEDTVDVPIHGVLRLAFRADRPGDWMQHCHILPHAAGGMMTVLRVLPTE